MMRFSTEHLRKVFEDADKYENFKKLTYNLNHGIDIYEYDDDGNQRKVSKHEANKAIRKIIMEEFWSREKVMLAVAEISGDHHDLTLQYLNEGIAHKIHTKKYGVKIGKDIDLILLGRIDFTELTDKIAEAFVYKVQELCYTGIYGAATKLPNNSQFVKTGALSASTKDKFDTLLEDVGTANSAEVVIMGTKTALKKLNGLTEVDWRSLSQKEDVAKTSEICFQ